MKTQKQDLEIAQSLLKERNLTLIVVKGGKILFKTKSQGIRGFLQAIEDLGKELVASSVADKVVGSAAAMLCAYSGIDSVFAVTISEGGIRVLEDNGIDCQFENQVSNILNQDKTDICPFEKLVIGSKDLKEAYTKLKTCAESGGKKLGNSHSFQ